MVDLVIMFLFPIVLNKIYLVFKYMQNVAFAVRLANAIEHADKY